MNYPPHVDDEYADVTPMGASEPEFILVRSGAASRLAIARAWYLSGRITAEEFEDEADDVFFPKAA